MSIRDAPVRPITIRESPYDHRFRAWTPMSEAELGISNDKRSPFIVREVCVANENTYGRALRAARRVLGIEQPNKETSSGQGTVQHGV